jgi:signal-transduction protein with cAMP-binding, CBS, and nucleotidyltransferase domain
LAYSPVSDLLDRVVLADLPLTAPISQAMSPDPFMLEEHATAYDAMLAMATHGIRHVLVTDAEGKLTGVVSERDLFALQRVGLRQIRQTIESAAQRRCPAAVGSRCPPTVFQHAGPGRWRRAADPVHLGA